MGHCHVFGTDCWHDLIAIFVPFQKYLEMEDAVEGEKKDLQDKVESLESIVRMLELKSKNSADHGEY